MYKVRISAFSHCFVSLSWRLVPKRHLVVTSLRCYHLLYVYLSSRDISLKTLDQLKVICFILIVMLVEPYFTYQYCPWYIVYISIAARILVVLGLIRPYDAGNASEWSTIEMVSQQSSRFRSHPGPSWVPGRSLIRPGSRPCGSDPLASVPLGAPYKLYIYIYTYLKTLLILGDI